ncbi:PREDICTED: interferon-induced transmembrane protein 1 [Charadrius vociferus]|uniref:interferon-induced transmembrane protein 1 n=1 Tax=Charadrius vociferus TaxID=50402 RepID=UPI00052143DF|nr:PREDICTED: interferon-induced transmembrane protein 1 [Charadrius vociferus]
MADFPQNKGADLENSRDRKVLGDYSGALSYGSTAKYLNITALVINIFLIFLFIALLATGTIAMANIFHQQKEHYPFPGPT